MKLSSTALLAPLAALSLLAPLSSAQVPKMGDYYEDALTLGFKVRVPQGWDFTPPQPNDANLIAKLTPPYNKSVSIGSGSPLWLEAYVLRFDRRTDPNEGAVTTDEEGNVEIDLKKLRSAHPDLDTWFERELHWARGARRQKKDATRVDKTEASELLYTAKLSGGDEFHLYAMVYHLEPDLEVAYVFSAPSDARRWRNYQMSFQRMAKSFRRVDLKEIRHSGAVAGDSPYRSRRRGELERQVATQPGWELHETHNYFIVSNVDDRAFINELKDRLEAIRAVYEELYPWDQVERIRLEADAAAKEEAEPEAAEGQEGEDGRPRAPTFRSRAADASPRELSRCSVVRVCAKQEEYHEYGGPRGSAGYWYSVTEELVLYDDKRGGGRRDTWAVLNHEAFHQYIFYLYGNIAPHYWYNEGTGDFFGGYEYKNRRFTLKPFSWRQRTIQQAIREGKHIPLKDFVRYERDRYYGAQAMLCYAQGWSLIWFLRTGQRSRGFQPSWAGILDTYFETLAATGDLEKALEAAFAGIDWNAFEEAWKEYTLRG